MTEPRQPQQPTDPVDRLRAANPVPEAVSNPSLPAVRATLEEILLDTRTTAATDTPDLPSRPTRPTRWLLAVAAALVVVAAVAGVLARGDDDTAPDVASLPTNPDAAGDDAPGDLSPGGEPSDGVTPGDGAGTQLTSCVEMYSLETLSNRAYAFDGTVASVDGNDMTFTVNEWFTGGTGDAVTLDHQGYAGMLFGPDGPSLDPGTRVLVAGDGGFVWSCGFTQLYEPGIADQWRSTLTR